MAVLKSGFSRLFSGAVLVALVSCGPNVYPSDLTGQVVGFKDGRTCLVAEKLVLRLEANRQSFSGCYILAVDGTTPEEALPVGACAEFKLPAPFKWPDEPATLIQKLDRPCDIPAGQLQCIWEDLRTSKNPNGQNNSQFDSRKCLSA